jgi:soluble lytic murein transglycosylase-like protein
VGNVVPLEAIAIADDAEVRYREHIASEAAARARSAREAANRRSSSRSVSAGSGVRLRPMGNALSGLSELARRYLSPEAQSVYPRYYAFIANHNKRLRTDEVDAIAVSILYFAQRHRVDPRLIVALIIAESDFDPQSTSHKGAMGLGQVMPDEARAFRLTNPYDPIENVRASVNMLRMKLDMYREKGMPEGQMTVRQIELAMAAYNAGAGAVKRHGGIPPYRETQRYVTRVLSLYKTLCGG